MFTILALDQATVKTGWALMDKNGLKEYGRIELDKDMPMIPRLHEMYNRIEKLIDELKPSFIVFEGTQYQGNAWGFRALCNLQGLVMSIMFKKGYGFFIIEPSSWKSYCGIRGRTREAQKADIIRFVSENYHELVGEDEADAIGIGTWAIENIREERS